MPNFSYKQLCKWREEDIVKTDIDLPYIDKESLEGLIKDIDKDLNIERGGLTRAKNTISSIKFNIKCLEKRRKKALAALDKINGN